MKRFVLGLGAVLSLMTVTLAVSFAVDHLMRFDVRLAVWSLCALGALIVLGRSMHDKHYGKTGGTGVKPVSEPVVTQRDIGHLPGRAHRTFADAASSGIGHLRRLVRAGHQMA